MPWKMKGARRSAGGGSEAVLFKLKPKVSFVLGFVRYS